MQCQKKLKKTLFFGASFINRPIVFKTRCGIFLFRESVVKKKANTSADFWCGLKPVFPKQGFHKKDASKKKPLFFGQNLFYVTIQFRICKG